MPNYKILVIEDLGGDKSVTNDIDNISKDLLKANKIESDELPNLLMIYRDSEGVYDEIRFSKSMGVTFYPLTETDKETAMTKLYTNKIKWFNGGKI